MTPLAQQALARARMPVRQPVATRPAKSATKARIYAPSPTIYASPAPVHAPSPPPGAAPTDQFQLSQGRRYAIEIVESCGAQLNNAWGLKDLVARLEKSVANKPPSFAQGVSMVVEMLRAHLAEVPADAPVL